MPALRHLPAGDRRPTGIDRRHRHRAHRRSQQAPPPQPAPLGLEGDDVEGEQRGGDWGANGQGPQQVGGQPLRTYQRALPGGLKGERRRDQRRVLDPCSDLIEQGRQMLVEVDDGLLEFPIEEVAVGAAGEPLLDASHHLRIFL